MLTFLYQIFSTGLFSVFKNFKFDITRFNCFIYEKTNFLTLKNNFLINMSLINIMIIIIIKSFILNKKRK